MGGWVAAVYTSEQMERLHVNELGETTKAEELTFEQLEQLLPGLLPVMINEEPTSELTHMCDCPPAMAIRQCDQKAYESNRKTCIFYIQQDQDALGKKLGVTAKVALAAVRFRGHVDQATE